MNEQYKIQLLFPHLLRSIFIKTWYLELAGSNMDRPFLYLFLISFVVAALLFHTVQGRDGTRIRGGTDAVAGEFPYQVSLEVAGQSICGGGIISEWFVVSAAHCFITRNIFKYDPVKVVAGIYKLRNFQSTREEADVDTVYIPSAYLLGSNEVHPLGDISLLKLRQPLRLSSYVTALQLPQPYSTYTGSKAVISGFGVNYVDVKIDQFTGRAEERNGRSTGSLRFAETRIIEPHMCSQMYGNYIDDSLVCAQVVQHDARNPEGVCSGDSGGPLVVNRNTLIGTVSTSPIGCVENVRPGIYTRVSSYLDFIAKAKSDVDDDDVLKYKLKVVPRLVAPVRPTPPAYPYPSITPRAPIHNVKKTYNPPSGFYFPDEIPEIPLFGRYYMPNWL